MENRIITIIGFYGSLILASTSKEDIGFFLYMGFAIFWLIRYVYLLKNKQI
jgi:hypothetical protein